MICILTLIIIGCLTFGPHFNPFNETHGGPDAEHRHVGDFGNIIADTEGNSQSNLTSNSIKLYGHNSVIGLVFSSILKNTG